MEEHKKYKKKRTGIAPNKDRRLFLRCTEEEYQNLLKKSKHFGTVSSYLRMMIFDSRKNIIDPQSLLKMVNEYSAAINRVGNNINQIAKHMNMASKTNIVDLEIIARSEQPIKDFVCVLEELKRELHALHNIS